MKYVYVLTSTTADLYYEQALMSAYSLRKQMPDSEIIFLVDDKTELTFTEENKRLSLKNYASKIIPSLLSQKFPTLTVPAL